MNAQKILEEVKAEYKAKWEAYDQCPNCGLEGEGGNNPWRHTFRFETDETICKRCGASYEASYDHHAEYRNNEVHAIQEREAS